MAVSRALELQAVQDSLAEYVEYLEDNEAYEGSSDFGGFADCDGTSHDDWYIRYYAEGGGGYPITSESDFTFLYGVTDYLLPVNLVGIGPVNAECRLLRDELLKNIRIYTEKLDHELLHCTELVEEEVEEEYAVTVTETETADRSGSSGVLSILQIAVLDLVEMISSEGGYDSTWD